MAFSSSPVLLAKKTTYDTNSFTLSDDINNYENILVIMACTYSNWPAFVESTIVPTSLINLSVSVDATRYSDNDESVYCVAEVMFTDSTHAKLYRTLSSLTFKELYIFGVN